jgi:hypothetical protein
MLPNEACRSLSAGPVPPGHARDVCGSGSGVQQLVWSARAVSRSCSARRRWASRDLVRMRARSLTSSRSSSRGRCRRAPGHLDSRPGCEEDSNIYTVQISWGGWGSNPRPADYEKPGPVLRALCLHRYHEVLPPIAQIAPLARVTRSTSRSTPDHDDRQILATERYSDGPRLKAWHGLFCYWTLEETGWDVCRVPAR